MESGCRVFDGWVELTDAGTEAPFREPRPNNKTLTTKLPAPARAPDPTGSCQPIFRPARRQSAMTALSSNVLADMFGGAAPQRPVLQITEIKRDASGRHK